jgi:hypothetical protein
VGNQKTFNAVLVHYMLIHDFFLAFRCVVMESIAFLHKIVNWCCPLYSLFWSSQDDQCVCLAAGIFEVRFILV